MLRSTNSNSSASGGLKSRRLPFPSVVLIAAQTYTMDFGLMNGRY